jgi:hypothetical protein
MNKEAVFHPSGGVMVQLSGSTAAPWFAVRRCPRRPKSAILTAKSLGIRQISDKEGRGGTMPGLSDLTPAERARLLGKPEGELGIALGEVMNQTNAKLIETVYRRLRLQPRQSVLEIGFGNGHTAPLLIQQADALTYTGIEIAQTMVTEATHLTKR